MRIHRRDFLRRASSTAFGFMGLRILVHGEGHGERGKTEPARKRLTLEDEAGYGPLLTDPEGIFDLPLNFSYRILSATGDRMSDKLQVPGAPDGMAAFAGPRGRVILVRNHELESTSSLGAFGRNNELFDRVEPDLLYDLGRNGEPSLGGTTTLVYHPISGKVEKQYLSLAGTERNCAGGPTPWGSWLTCEESVTKAGTSRDKNHGFVFEVPARKLGLSPARPIPEMGRFLHEAAAIDPTSGYVYMTEDRANGLLYRYLPDQPGRLAAGGRLQALRVIGSPGLNTNNHSTANQIPVGAILDVEWVDLSNVNSSVDDLRLRGRGLGAAIFSRGEGMWWGEGSLYFCATSGGLNRAGQVWRLSPGSSDLGAGVEGIGMGELELFVEPNDSTVMDMADNITTSAFGDLVVCEDGGGENNLLGITSAGEVYNLGHNALNCSELTGATFSPDGSLLFVNIQRPGITLAIEGPW
ncbi:MAG: alkaline phosphatase PhoX [Planctomycetota bacterium]